jgi:hypothetical protein
MEFVDARNELDLDTAYRVEGWGSGIAWHCLGYVMIRDEDYEWSGYEYPNEEWVRMVMIGDDRVFEIELSEITPISDDEYCPGCGQIGCKAYG